MWQDVIELEQWLEAPTRRRPDALLPLKANRTRVCSTHMGSTTRTARTKLARHTGSHPGVLPSTPMRRHHSIGSSLHPIHTSRLPPGYLPATSRLPPGYLPATTLVCVAARANAALTAGPVRRCTGARQRISLKMSICEKTMPPVVAARPGTDPSTRAAQALHVAKRSAKKKQQSARAHQKEHMRRYEMRAPPLRSVPHLYKPREPWVAPQPWQVCRVHARTTHAHAHAQSRTHTRTHTRPNTQRSDARQCSSLRVIEPCASSHSSMTCGDEIACSTPSRRIQARSTPHPS
jgi:hypothetical protein